MYATLHPVPAVGDGDPLAVVGGQPDGAVAVADDDGSEGTLVALWPDRDAAGAAGGRIYAVTDVMTGPAAGRPATHAQLVWLNGDGDPAAAAAVERSNRERIWPAVRSIEGVVASLVLRSADDRFVVVGLAVDPGTHERVREAIGATELLPGEDPALLRGPDRIRTGRVLLARLPVEARS
ncbi:hypothetical protein [Blastococcus sp. SYSU D00820]